MSYEANTFYSSVQAHETRGETSPLLAKASDTDKGERGLGAASIGPLSGLSLIVRGASGRWPRAALTRNRVRRECTPPGSVGPR